MKEKGYTQVYTGNGKGKTTAALGLIMRAAGAGFKIYLGQFIKSLEYHEVRILRDLPGVTVELYGEEGCIVGRRPDESDIRCVREGLARANEILRSGEYDLVVLDEIFIASHFGLVTDEELLALMDTRPENTELVMTGRYAPEAVLDHADLVTEMKEIRHYYEKGVLAREGIER